MMKYLLKTILFSFIAIMIVLIGTFGTFFWNISFMLPVSLILFAILVTGYILYHIPRIRSSSSIIVKDGDALWYLTFKPYMGSYASKIFTRKRDNESSGLTKYDIKFLTNAISDIKANRYTFRIFNNGYNLAILHDYKVKKETKNFYYVDAITELYMKGPKRSVVKIEKAFEGMDELFKEN